MCYCFHISYYKIINTCSRISRWQDKKEKNLMFIVICARFILIGLTHKCYLLCLPGDKEHNISLLEQVNGTQMTYPNKITEKIICKNFVNCLREIHVLAQN